MNALHTTLAELIQIPSVNSFYEGGQGEQEVAHYIRRFFAKAGIETKTQLVLPSDPPSGERSNVIAILPGKSSERRVVLEAHMDTVSVQGMSIDPFRPSIQAGKMYGRGSCDTKGGLAAMMHALVDLRKREILPECEVWFAAVVDEEFSFRGALKLCESLSADAAIVAEPTELRLVVASKGVLRWRMVAHGKSAHSSKTHLGNNAIYAMARVILALEQHHQALQNLSHPLLGSPSCNVGKVRGGVQVNFVPDQCAIEIDRRLLPGEEVDAVLQSYRDLIDNAGRGVDGFHVTMDPPMLIDEAWTCSANAPIIEAARKTLDSMGLPSDRHGVPFGSDASKFGRAGIDTILFGPGSIDQAHSAIEFIELEQVDRAFEFYRDCILNFAATSPP